MNERPNELPQAHLLIVDDDERIRDLLKKYLVRQDFWVSSARDAAHAKKLLAGLDFDLIIMDVMMPGEDGIALTKSIRETRATPILLLTAMGGTEDRIKGLEAGADDYLAKPFEPKELLLRVNSILRRMPALTQQSRVEELMLGDKRYNIERAELWQGDAQVRLTTTEAHLMRIFAATPGEPVTRGDLVEQLGRDQGQAQKRAVDVQITRLRRKLEVNSKEPRYLMTVRGAGYMLAPD